MYRMKISDRLKNIISLVDRVDTVADIASDHGIVPIELLNNNIVKYAIATDINEKPLLNLKNNIELYLNEDKRDNIELRLGDGLKVIKYDEADIIIVTGIGFDLMADILSDIEKYNFKYLILSSQSKFYEFRKFLHSKKLDIVDEIFMIEDEKEYFIIKAKLVDFNPNYDEECYYMYSKILIDRKDLLLKNYIKKIIDRLEKILNQLDPNTKRFEEIKNDIDYSYQALKHYGE